MRTVCFRARLGLMQGGVFNSPTFNVQDFKGLTFLVVSVEDKRGYKNLLYKILSMQISSLALIKSQVTSVRSLTSKRCRVVRLEQTRPKKSMTVSSIGRPL